jgi:hypothetical protein
MLCPCKAGDGIAPVCDQKPGDAIAGFTRFAN